jgi:hypothetical protein
VNGFLRWSAALAGTLPPAVLAAVALARHLPLSIELRYALGFLLLIPLWVAAICTACLIERGGRAWLLCLALTGLLALV